MIERMSKISDLIGASRIMNQTKTKMAVAAGLAVFLAASAAATAQVQNTPPTLSSNVSISLMYVTNAPNDRFYTPCYVFSIVNHDRKPVRLRGMFSEVPSNSILLAPVINPNLPRGGFVELLEPGESVVQAVGSPSDYEVWRLRIDFSPNGTANPWNGLTNILTARSSWVPWISVYPRSADGPQKNSSPVADDAVEAACRKAASETKSVFLKSGYPECAACVLFDHYHNLLEVRKIIEKYYVIVSIDTENMPDGCAVFGKYAKPGAPSWVILSPGKSVIVDSYASPDGNVGFPETPNGAACYLAALQKATPAITKDELSALANQLKKAAGK
jgi:hypothetical protein